MTTGPPLAAMDEITTREELDAACPEPMTLFAAHAVAFERDERGTLRFRVDFTLEVPLDVEPRLLRLLSLFDGLMLQRSGRLTDEAADAFARRHAFERAERQIMGYYVYYNARKETSVALARLSQADGGRKVPGPVAWMIANTLYG